LTKSYVFPTVIISGLFLLSKRFSHNVAMQKKVANLAKGISAVFTNPIMRSRFEWSFHKNRRLTNLSYFLANCINYYTTPQCYFSWIIQGPLTIWSYHSLFFIFRLAYGCKSGPCGQNNRYFASQGIKWGIWISSFHRYLMIKFWSRGLVTASQ